MKRNLCFLLCLILTLGCFAGVSAADAVSVSYTFGDVPGKAATGETVTVPIYLTVTGTPANGVTFRLSFNEEAFEFQTYKSSTDKGDHKLGLSAVGLTQNDSSVVGAAFVSSNGNTAETFENTLLCSLRFTVKENAQPGEYEFNVVKSEVSCDVTDAEVVKSEEFSAETLTMEITDAESGITGDTDGDGKVTVTDVCNVLKHAAGVETISEEKQKYADVDPDGEITVTDATRILKYIARLINEL